MITLEQEIFGKRIKLEYTLQPIKFDPNPGTEWPTNTLSFNMNLYHNDHLALRFPYRLGLGHLQGKAKKAFNEFHQRKVLCFLEILQAELKKTAQIEKQTEITIRDILWTLAMDSDVLNHSCFSEWADAYSYNQDSIKDREIYRFCIELALGLKQVFTDDELQRLTNEEDLCDA